MQSLYSNGFEHIYDKMYQTFINYKEEYTLYSTIIDKYKATTVLEIGCGTGNLAKFFIASHLSYKGLDLSEDMINLSKNKNPKGDFIQGEITEFTLNKKVDAIIIPGRTTSYLTTNKDIFNALNCISNNLNTGGIISFDFIDATRFFKEIKGGKKIQHSSSIDNNMYNRDSFMKPNKNLDNFMFDWHAIYYNKENGISIKITEDNSTVRAFTKEEWELFLELSSFKLLEIIDKKSYAFDTYVIVAQKK
jgi:SAM-dependent methyltransferase